MINLRCKAHHTSMEKRMANIKKEDYVHIIRERLARSLLNGILENDEFFKERSIDEITEIEMDVVVISQETFRRIIQLASIVKQESRDGNYFAQGIVDTNNISEVEGSMEKYNNAFLLLHEYEANLQKGLASAIHP